MKLALSIACAALIAGCSSPAAPPTAADETPETAATMVEPVADVASPDPAAIEAAKAAIAAEPKVKDLTYGADDAVQWNVGVFDDGSSRVGYAEYLCQVIAEKGALAGRTHVRIVDIARVGQGANFRDANLGHVICETGDVVDA